MGSTLVEEEDICICTIKVGLGKYVRCTVTPSHLERVNALSLNFSRSVQCCKTSGKSDKISSKCQSRPLEALDMFRARSESYGRNVRRFDVD